MQIKGRNYSIILYPKSKSYNFDEKLKTLINFVEEKKGEYYYILHDSDIGANGEDIEEHYHFIMYLPKDTQTTIKNIIKVCGIPCEHLEKIDKSNTNILYLAHESPNSMSKYNYDWHTIQTNNENKIRRIFCNDEETKNVYAILSYIDSCKYITFTDFSKFILNNNLWSYYRRSGSIINGLIREHNDFFVSEKQKKVDKTI